MNILFRLLRLSQSLRLSRPSRQLPCRNFKTIGLAAVVCSLFAMNAEAHMRWDPNGLIKPRSTRDDLKVGPCGGIARTNNPVVLQSGSTVTVQFESTIFHKGFFRIAFSPSGDTGFDQNVIVKDIADISGQRFRSQTITLPNIECDQCSLQLIQSMLDRTPPSNYFSCADIKLVKPTPPPPVTPADITNLSALPGDRQVVLNWKNPPQAKQILVVQQGTQGVSKLVDGTYYKDGTGGGAPGLVGDAVMLKNVWTNETFTVANLNPGQTYTFSIFNGDTYGPYSKGVSTTVKVPSRPENIAPTATLDVEQNMARTLSTVQPKNGVVLVQATVNDLNPIDKHYYDWSSSDSRLKNFSGVEDQFRFDPVNLAPGQYSVVLTVTDDGSPPLSTTKTIVLEVLKAPEPPAPATTAGSISFTWLLTLLLPLGLIRRLKIR